MSTAEQETPLAPQRPRFSIGTMLLGIGIICLLIMSVLTQSELSALKREQATLKRELVAQQPLQPEEVARQFEQRTTLGPIAVKVQDVRYSPASDSYKVSFSWTDKTTKQSWSSDVKPTADGYGTYYGRIRNDPFIVPLGYKDGFPVVVQTPSPLAR